MPGTKRTSDNSDEKVAKKQKDSPVSGRYKQVGGKKLDVGTLTLADAFLQKREKITFVQAKALWNSACDGPGVTPPEFSALKYVAKNYSLTKKGKRFLLDKVVEKKSGVSKYKQIEKVRYERDILDKAEFLAQDGSINLSDAKIVWTVAEDGPGVTETEKNTIQYVIDNYKLIGKAKSYLQNKHDKVIVYQPPARKSPKPKKQTENEEVDPELATLRTNFTDLASQFTADQWKRVSESSPRFIRKLHGYMQRALSEQATENLDEEGDNTDNE